MTEQALMDKACTVAQEILDESNSHGYTQAHLALLASAYVRGFSEGMAHGERLLIEAIAEAINRNKETMQ